MTTLAELRELFPRPSTPCPPAPAYHVESRACSYGWIAYPNGEPTWQTCDCEDPTNPWPPRLPTDGPVDCGCYHCSGKLRADRGHAPCEYENHCCPSCHEAGICTSHDW